MRSAFFVVATITCMGCGETETEKSSYFEHDHEIVAHWPADLGDTALKIRDRVRISKMVKTNRPTVAREIIELVSWVSEIAADTELTEEQWIPLDQISQTLFQQLQNDEDPLTPDRCQQLEDLCVQIDAAVKTLSIDEEIEVTE